jgi:hypothetical protein
MANDTACRVVYHHLVGRPPTFCRVPQRCVPATEQDRLEPFKLKVSHERTRLPRRSRIFKVLDKTPNKVLIEGRRLPVDDSWYTSSCWRQNQLSTPGNLG